MGGVKLLSGIVALLDAASKAVAETIGNVSGKYHYCTLAISSHDVHINQQMLVVKILYSS